MSVSFYRTFLISTFCAFATAGFAGSPGVAFFTDGNEAAFSATPTKGQTDQVLGRVQIFFSAGGSNADLTNIEIALGSAPRSGLTNLKVWTHANDSNFAGSTLYATVAADPGDNSPVFFGGSANLSLGSNYYIFLTADLASNASGTASPTVVDFDMTAGATKNGFTSGDPMTNSAVALPVSLSRFQVE